MTDSNQEQRAALVMMLRAHGIRDIRVLGAFERVPRLAFACLRRSEAEAASLRRRQVDGTLAARAMRDSPLPLPCGQTMERPSHAARMIEALEIEPEHHVLEIGAGSGWLTGVLANLAAKVTAVERYRDLCAAASQRFDKLGLSNIRLKQGDGVENREGPYDRIFLNAAVETVPQNLLAQLKECGRLVAGLGAPKGKQQFTRFSKSSQGVKQESLWPVYMQPLESGCAAVL